MFRGPVMKALGWSKRALTYGATFGPAFRVANAFRDTLHTSIVSKSFSPFIDTWRGAIQVARKSEDYISLMGSAGGFGQGYLDANDPEAMSRQIRKMIKREGEGVIGRIIDSPRKLLHFWEYLGHVSEMAARTQLYTNHKISGKDHEEAAFMSRDILDFGLSGQANVMRAAASAIPFLNARVQGLDRMYRGAKEDPKAFAVKGALLALASIALWSLFKDDERYKELEDWEKWTYHHFWIGDQHFRMPKAFEVGAIFSSLPEALGDIVNGNEDIGYFGDFLSHTATQTFAVGLPSLVSPTLEVATNRSFFTGRDIENIGDKSKPAGLRADPWTSETLTVIGEKFNISPKKLQTLIRGHFATLGMFFLGMADIATANMADLPKRPTTKINQYPLVGRFMRDDINRTKYTTRVYDTFKEIDRLAGAIKVYKDTGNTKMANEIARDNRKLLRYRTMSNRMRAELTKIRNKEKMIWYNRRMSPDQKRAMLDSLARKKNSMFKSVYNRLN